MRITRSLSNGARKITKKRQVFATEAALELKKSFNSTQNYVKMIDHTIDEMEKDPDYK